MIDDRVLATTVLVIVLSIWYFITGSMDSAAAKEAPAKESSIVSPHSINCTPLTISQQ